MIALDVEWRKRQFELEQCRKDVGAQQKAVAELKKAGAAKAAEADAAVAAMGALKARIPALEESVDALKAQLERELNKVPNEVDASVPVSKDEEHNVVVRQWGACETREGLLHHHELLAMIDGYEPERGVGVAGHRAYFLKGYGVLLNQALINYGLAFLLRRSYTPMQPPFFMNKEAMAGIAQLEDFDEQLYKVSGETAEEDKYLIATSEQPICAFHRGEWLAEKDLPKRYAGYSACFRKEAGSGGRDTWGIFRVHQFDKVEQFIVCEPEESPKHHKAMVETAEAFYQSLGIPYRVVNICSGELNNAAAIKYDLEGWFPTLANYRELVSTSNCLDYQSLGLGYRVINICSGELNNAAAVKYDLEGWFPTLGNFRELVSCSNCTDYQARAMEVRCGLNKKAGPAGEPAKKYVHFLNGTLCATTRTICAILENYQVRRESQARERACDPPPLLGRPPRQPHAYTPPPFSTHTRSWADCRGRQGARRAGALYGRAHHAALCAGKAHQRGGQAGGKKGGQERGRRGRGWRRSGSQRPRSSSSSSSAGGSSTS